MVNPGDKIGYEINGVIYTATVSEVKYESAKPAIYKQPSWWKRLLGHRQPKLIRPATPETTVITAAYPFWGIK